MKVHCDYCGKELDRKPSWVKRHKHHFCNKNHYDEWQREWQREQPHLLPPYRICPDCGGPKSFHGKTCRKCYMGSERARQVQAVNIARAQATIRGSTRNPEQRENYRRAAFKRWEDPERRRWRSEQSLQYWATHEHPFKGRTLSQTEKEIIGKANTKYEFDYTQMSSSLAYIIGVYLGDGWCNNNQFQLQVVDEDFADYFANQVKKLFPSQYVAKTPRNPIGKQRQVSYRVTFCNVQFASWLLSVSNHKTQIPPCILGTLDIYQKHFTEGLMDSDGFVIATGLYFANSAPWIDTFHTLIQGLQIRVSGLRIQQILPSGKPYKKFSIDSSDYIQAGIRFNVARKQKALESLVAL